MSIGLQRIYHQLEEELSAFENHINKLEVLNYPLKSCRILIKELLEKTKKYKEVMRRIMEDSSEGGLEEAKRKLIAKVHNPLIQEDVKFLDWLRDAETGSVPWSFIPCIEKLAEEILPNRKVLVYCKNSFNYGVSWSQSEKLAPYPYYVFALPKLHRINVLWHALIGHELFHPRCSEFINKHNQEVLSNITKQVVSLLEKSRLEESSETLFSEAERKDRIDTIGGIIHLAWRRAMEELLCDMACVEIFGPAAVLAMKAFSACSPSNEMPEPKNNFYPSWQYRFEVVYKHFEIAEMVQVLLEKFKNKEIIKPFEEEMKGISNLVERGEGAALIKEHPYAKIAYEQIEILLSNAIKFVRGTIPNTVCRWHDKKVLDQIPVLVERLKGGIPPNEVVGEVSGHDPEKYNTDPAELAGILISGWIYEEYWQTEEVDDGKFMKYSTMARLILKACEDIQLTT